MHLNQLILRGGGIERAGIHINVHAANLYQRHIGLRRGGDRRVPRSHAEVSFRIRGQALAIKNRKPGRGGGFVEVGMAKRGQNAEGPVRGPGNTENRGQETAVVEHAHLHGLERWGVTHEVYNS